MTSNDLPHVKSTFTQKQILLKNEIFNLLSANDEHV